MGNPVADGIEREGKNHKGIRMRWPQPDRVIKRALVFFRTEDQGGVTPDEVVLRFTRPPGFAALSNEELDLLLENRVIAYQEKKRAERDAKRLGFRCDRTDEKSDPRSHPKSPHKLFRLAPLMARNSKSSDWRRSHGYAWPVSLASMLGRALVSVHESKQTIIIRLRALSRRHSPPLRP